MPPSASVSQPAPTVSAAPCEAPADYNHWFTSEVHPHGPKLEAYIRGSYPSIKDVDDIVQESYIRIWKRRLAGPLDSAKSYLYRIARNLAVDTIRRRSIAPFESVSDYANLNVLDKAPSAAEAACTNEELALLMAAIEALPPRCREVVILRKLHGLSAGEIAARLGLEEGTVHLYGSRGVRRCEAFLRERGYGGSKR